MTRAAAALLGLAGLAALAVTLAPDAALADDAPPAAPSWEAAFSTAHAPATVHFHASYKDAGGRDHTLEVWRDGASLLRRRTDDALDLLVERKTNGDYAYRLVDHAARRIVRVSRTSLYRIGTFSDWKGLSSSLTKPTGPFTLRAGGAGLQATPVGVCTRVRIERTPGPTDEVCWSTAWGLPLRIRRTGPTGEMQTVFAVDRIESSIAGPSVFRVATSRMVEIDADDDIAPAGGE